MWSRLTTMLPLSEEARVLQAGAQPMQAISLLLDKLIANKLELKYFSRRPGSWSVLSHHVLSSIPPGNRKDLLVWMACPSFFHCRWINLNIHLAVNSTFQVVL